MTCCLEVSKPLSFDTTKYGYARVSTTHQSTGISKSTLIRAKCKFEKTNEMIDKLNKRLRAKIV